MAKRTTKKTSKTSSHAKRIVEEQVDIRSRMHGLVRDAITTGKFSTEEVGRAVHDAFAGVRAGLAKAVPSDHDNILHQTFDGMSDAVAAGAESARKAFEHAKDAGRRMSGGELRTFVSTMRSLEEEFLDAVSDAAEGMSDESRKYLDEVVRRAKSAGTKIGPASTKALKVAAKHGPDLAIETMKAGGRAAAGVAGEVAMGVSGLLSGLGSALRGAAKERPAKKVAKKSTAKSRKPARASSKTVRAKR
ncbi:MAG: DUF6781 family protein [Phycisphaerales bacterium]